MQAHDHRLHIDGFGLTIDTVSVGLPVVRTSEIILLRYLDLLRLVRNHPGRGTLEPAHSDVTALAAATGLERDTVVTRLRALQL